MSAREQFDDEQLERMQQRIKALETVIANCPFVVGARVEADLTTASKTIAHRLGRKPLGLIVISAKPDAAVGFSATQPSDTKVLVNVEASASTTASLWFF